MKSSYRKGIAFISLAGLSLGCFAFYQNLRHKPTVNVADQQAPLTSIEVRSLPNGLSQRALSTDEISKIQAAMPCDETVITHLDLSRPPTEAELVAAGNLGEKLTPTRSADAALIKDPVARKAQEADNLVFGIAIQAWNEHRYEDAYKLFEEHLKNAPTSPWAAESMLHLGCYSQYVARFGESRDWFDKILEVAPTDTEMYHKAKLRRAILNIDLGTLDEATAAFGEMMKNDPDPDHQSYASYWLMQTAFLKQNEIALRDCGQKALSRAARIVGLPDAADELYQREAAGSHGFTALELHTTALENGLKSVPVQAKLALDALPLPFIAHYNDRHYVTVEAVEKDHVRVYDSRIAASTDMPRTSFDKEWSGFALLMDDAPKHEHIYPAENLERIVGGCCGQPTQVSDLGDDGGDCDKACGLPQYDVNIINMNFTVKDTPMWWDAPYGPSIYMTLMFNSQDSLNNYTPFGPKWSFEYASYLLVTPGERVQVKDGDGRLETFTPGATSWEPPSAANNYTLNLDPVPLVSPPGDERVLYQYGSHDFFLEHQDGTRYYYGIPANASSNSNVPLLLKIRDRFNNEITITHNANGAVTAVAHSALPNVAWNFVYDTINGQFSRITRIDDPFGRSCHFGYSDEGLLTSQEDMGGLSYSYDYSSKNAIDATKAYGGQTAVPQLFISEITTPTGTTQILTEPADGQLTANTDYTAAERAMGYWMGYPPPGRAMWTNYRIQISDHKQAVTEYHFDGSTSNRYRRDPEQMAYVPTSTNQNIPYGRAYIKYTSILVGGKGTLNSIYQHAGAESVTLKNDFSYQANSRLPKQVWVGNGKYHDITRNAQFKPTTIKLYSESNEDYWIQYGYEPNNIDLNSVQRKKDGVLKTLASIDYYPNSRNIESITTPAYNGATETTRTLTVTWLTNGLVDTITDSLTGDVVDYNYDANGRPYQVFLNGNLMQTTTYDVEGRLRGILDANQAFTSHDYDDLNRLTRSLNDDNTFAAYQWACCYIEQTKHGVMQGNQEKILRRTITQHDARALPLKEIRHDGTEIQYDYDSNGRIKKIIDENNKQTQFFYDEFGNLQKKIYPDNTFEEFIYTGTYKPLKQIKGRNGSITNIDYHDFGFVDEINVVQHPEYSSYYRISAYYNKWQQLYQTTLSAAGTSGSLYEDHINTYDLLGRITSINGPWTDDTITWSYQDAARQVTRTAPGSNSQTTTADAYGRLSAITNALGTFTNTYESIGGPLSTITHTGNNAGFHTQFAYHDQTLNRALKSITSTIGNNIIARHTYGYDTLGQLTSWKREAPQANPSGATHQYQSAIHYNLADRLQSVVNTPLAGSTVPESAYHYSYDGAGNLKTIQQETASTANLRSYTVNDLNQITATSASGDILVRGNTNEPAKVQLKPASSPTWQDARHLPGNIFEKELPLQAGANTLDIRAQDGNQNTSNYQYSLNLGSGTQQPYNYDTAGRVTFDGTRTYVWDPMSRLIRIEWGAGSNKVTQYRYNSIGQRTETIEKTGSTITAHYRYLYDGLMPLCRYNGGQTAAHIDRRYYSQGEERKENGTWVSYYYCRDHLGSIREVVKGDSTLAARYDYDPYGLRLTRYQAINYPSCDFGYTGHITQHSPVSGQSEIVLTLYRAYDPMHARWLTPDPLGEAGGLNLYEYCISNPMSFRDPDGMLPWGMENWDMSDWMGMVPMPDEIADSARIGVGATIDGIVPFADPMKNSLGTYNDCETGAKESRFLGEVSRDIGLAAAGGGVGSAGGKQLPNLLARFSNKTKGALGESLSTIKNMLQGSRKVSSQIRVDGLRTIIDSAWRSRSGTLYYVESKFGTAGLTNAQRIAKRVLGNAYRVEKWTYPFFRKVGQRVGSVAGAGAGAAGSAALPNGGCK